MRNKFSQLLARIRQAFASTAAAPAMTLRGGDNDTRCVHAAVVQRPGATTPCTLLAKELLDSLPEDQRAFRLPAISPEDWWLV